MKWVSFFIQAIVTCVRSNKCFAGKFCLFERSSLFDILGNLFHFSVPYTFGTTTTTTASPSGLDLDTLEVNRYISDPFVVGEDYTGK